MGNQTSTTQTQDKKDINILVLMDTIAAKLVLTQDFNDLLKLDNKKYCDQLTILTSNVIKNRLNNIEITYLNQRVKDGYTIDKEEKDNIIFLKDKDLLNLDVPNSTKKTRMCIGISRFYIRIAQLFSAIVKTINPIYSYKNELGVTEKVPFMKKMSIPVEMRKKTTVSRAGICTNRINSMMISALKDTELTEIKDKDDTIVTGGSNMKYKINNKLCSMNVSKKIVDGTTMKETKTLIDEPGIPELIDLYKDVYDYKTGKFTKMSDKSKQDYEEDLKTFYTAFTGNKEIPEHIKKFSDIQLKDFHKLPACSNDEQGLNAKFVGVEISDKLMEIYGERMSKMIETMNTNQDKLIEVLDEIFVYRLDKKTGNKIITIHPNLSTQKLEKIIEKTRKLIVNIFVSCEEGFVSTLESFEAIIEEQIRKNIERKVQLLKEEEEKKISNVKIEQN
jgi:hypothetical protein